MFTFTDFQQAIDQQILHNRNKSMFYEQNGRLALRCSPLTAQLLTQKAAEITQFVQTSKREGTYTQLLQYAVNKSMRLFVEVNQFFDFTREDYGKLQQIYRDLLERVCELGNSEKVSETDIAHLFQLHYKHLQAFLFETNGTEICKKYKEHPHLFEITCAEYSPEFQLNLLNVRLETIKQPVLDLGCGSQASLVRFLRKRGIEAFGVDRNGETAEYVFKVGWLECPFKPNTWGTVISHMAFSNHFIHHHLRPDGRVEWYASKYMEILHSLREGGSFFYAPSLPFMEELLVSHSNSFVVVKRAYSTQILRATGTTVT